MIRLVLLSLFFYTAYGNICSSDIYNYGSWDSNTNTFTVTSNIPDSNQFSPSPFRNCDVFDVLEYSVVVADSVTSIGDGAFHSDYKNVYGMTSLTIGNSVETIGGNAFTNNGLTSLTIGNSVTFIGHSAFKGNSLTSLFIPDSVDTVEIDAFMQNSLTSVTIGNSVESILAGVFRNNALTTVDIPDSVTYIDETAFAYNALTTLDIPDSVTYIGDNAFKDNALTSVTTGNGLTHIGNDAFLNNPLTEFRASGTILMKLLFGLQNVQNAVVISNGITIIDDASCSELKSTYTSRNCCG